MIGEEIMMTKQTLEFNVGYVWAKIDKAYALAQDQGSKWFAGKVQLPLLWWDPNSYCRGELGQRIRETFQNCIPGWSLNLLIGIEGSYMVVNYRSELKCPPKKMTVNEIEKVLGYKVEIVSE